MANVMLMKNVKNKPSRNGFDISQKINFTAKAGELLPVWQREVLPGDKVTIDLSSFTRTQPVNTAAFARMREYYDFFFVPYQLIWNRANSVLSQMDYNQMHATSLSQSPSPFNGELPYITSEQIVNYLRTIGSESASTNIANNFFGYKRADLSVKLLEYLQYGNFENYYQDNATVNWYNLQFNVMSLFAYQKIYADFYRDEQWEKPNPSCFNLDYMTGSSSMNLVIDNQSLSEVYNFFDLRYCNWQKDLYHGLLPSPQYGDAAAVPISLGIPTSHSGDVSDMSGKIPFGVNLDAGGLQSAFWRFSDGASGPEPLPSNTSLSGSMRLSPQDLRDNGITGRLAYLGISDPSFSILALRQYEFLQKWKEIAQSGGQDYKSQTEKMWNVNVSTHLSEKVTYLGGTTGDLSINEVVNQNITGENAANIAGKGIGISEGKIEFDSDGQRGILMCIYHCVPWVDYTVNYINPSNLRINAEDFANPVFDRVGMESVSLLPIAYNGYYASTRLPETGDEDVAPSVNLGYAPRYVDYKTAIDLSLGEFKRSLSHWVVAYGEMDVLSSFSVDSNVGNFGDENVPAPFKSSSDFVSYVYLKVNPNLLDPIFAKAVDSTMATDQFLVSSFFDVKAVRNLDVDGLPY